MTAFDLIATTCPDCGRFFIAKPAKEECFTCGIAKPLILSPEEERRLEEQMRKLQDAVLRARFPKAFE